MEEKNHEIDRQKTEKKSPQPEDKQEYSFKREFPHILPVLLSVAIFPISLGLWLTNLGYTQILSGDGNERHVVHPIRWLVSVSVTVILILYGLKKRSLSLSGAFLSFFVGFTLTVSSYCFLACLFTFFMSSSKATKFGSKRKVKFEEDFKEGGQRNWIQVLCNGGMATLLALLYIVDVGCGERSIDFVKDYRASWLSIGILSALACSNGDTWASEIGSVVGSGNPILVTTLKKVPRGTNGGVSVIGTLASAVAGVLIGLSHYFTVLYTVDPVVLATGPQQYFLILIGAIAGFIGSLIDSFLGATLQYSGVDKEGKIVSHPAMSVEHISGRAILDNHAVNLLSSVITALIMPKVASWIYTSALFCYS